MTISIIRTSLGLDQIHPSKMNTYILGTFIMCCVSWSAIYLFISEALVYFPPITLTCLRFMSAVPFLLVYCGYKWTTDPEFKQQTIASFKIDQMCYTLVMGLCLIVCGGGVSFDNVHDIVCVRE